MREKERKTEREKGKWILESFQETNIHEFVVLEETGLLTYFQRVIFLQDHTAFLKQTNKRSNGDKSIY